MITDNKNVQGKNRFKRQSQRKLPILSRDDRKNKTEFKRHKQRKLPITSRGAVVMTYSERCSNLSNALFCGDRIPCKISKPRRRHNKVRQNEKTLVNNKRVQKLSLVVAKRKWVDKQSWLCKEFHEGAFW
jgi:hypothetical protein